MGHSAVNRADEVPVLMRLRSSVPSLSKQDCFVELPGLLASQTVFHEGEVLMSRHKEERKWGRKEAFSTELDLRADLVGGQSGS